MAEVSASLKALLVGGAGLLCLETLTGFTAHAQVNQQGSTSKAINLGGRGWAVPEAINATPTKEAETLQFSAKAGLASDYIYRGTTLSDRKPAAGAGIEATFDWFYAGATVATVKLPTRPDAEITMGAGVRPKLGNIEFDFGATYFLYPGEMPGGPTNGIEYGEVAARAGTSIGESIRIAAGYAYSPDVSKTGAWSQYAAVGLGYEVPSHLLPKDLSVSFTVASGYSWFGTQSPALGGFALPSYLNWQAGMTFTRKFVNLDLRYYDTNLSKENCYVFTGDPNARPGGRANPITNPDGLVSRWCSAAFVAKLWFALN